MIVEGTTAPAFDSLGQLFAEQTSRLLEYQAQLCVYHRGEKVVDLWVDNKMTSRFTADSLMNVFSSGKSLEAIAVASLVSKGMISYDAKISQFWPEFARNGKEDLTVADLMRHEAGLATFDRSVELQDLVPERIKQNAVGRIIEEQSLRYGRNNGKRVYHALTRGWIVNELFRRVDPGQRTVGEYLREEISGPLGADVYVGVEPQEVSRLVPVKLLSIKYQLLQGFLPRFMGRRVVHNVVTVIARLLRVLRGMRVSGRAKTPPAFSGTTDLNYFKREEFPIGETPSANASCSARGLARLAAVMAAGGSFDGREYISTDAWRAMHGRSVEALMGSVITTRFTQGGVDSFLPLSPGQSRLDRDFNEGREGFFGWMGFGGSIFQWHPDLELGFAFVPSALHSLDFLNERGKCFQAEAIRCAKLS